MLDIINWYGVLYVLGKGSYLYTYTTNTLYIIQSVKILLVHPSKMRNDYVRKGVVLAYKT